MTNERQHHPSDPPLSFDFAEHVVYRAAQAEAHTRLANPALTEAEFPALAYALSSETLETYFYGGNGSAAWQATIEAELGARGYTTRSSDGSRLDAARAPSEPAVEAAYAAMRTRADLDAIDVERIAFLASARTALPKETP